ncbi:membrane protein [Mycobacterium phage Quesadilla]|uniref:Membrane protein n=1 Tax=Mycobacterium phage Quesadilla TaxID=2664226 RepID=A0A5Q2WFH6_9CAUD|nr:membrane protein [Mycobacterium phage Quesadilla]QGH75267.1 membrane protein [Mycobacterium phage Quesadilla]
MASRLRVGRWLAHTRFVPTPLYRLILVAAVISSVLQLVFGAPVSVSAVARSESFSWAFVALQLAGAVLALIGLYLVEGESPPPWTTTGPDIAAAERAKINPEKLHRSLSIELLGLIFLQTVIAVQLAASAFDQGRIPSSLAIWVLAVFWGWSFFRDRDILRAMRKLTR